MDPKQRRQAILGGVLVVGILVLLIVKQAAGPSGAASYTGAGGAPASRQTAPEATVPVVDVKLEALAAARPDPIDEGRSPFRFQPKAPPPPLPAPPGASRPGSTVGPGGEAPKPVPTGPPPPPPISLKFIGVYEAGGRKVAVLSDGRATIHGREGEVVEGRYRIVRIGVESIEMEYTDGRGRQLIRLTGS
jgi:hypothetical protein